MVWFSYRVPMSMFRAIVHFFLAECFLQLHEQAFHGMTYSMPFASYRLDLMLAFKGKELIARVHLQMQLGKRRIELEVRKIRDSMQFS